MNGYLSLIIAVIFTIAAINLIMGAYMGRRKIWLPALIISILCVLGLVFLNFILPKL